MIGIAQILMLNPVYHKPLAKNDSGSVIALPQIRRYPITIVPLTCPTGHEMESSADEAATMSERSPLYAFVVIPEIWTIFN